MKFENLTKKEWNTLFNALIFFKNYNQSEEKKQTDEREKKVFQQEIESINKLIEEMRK